MVEVEGVEPSSEHIAIQLSPSAASILNFALTTCADPLCRCYFVKFSPELRNSLTDDPAKWRSYRSCGSRIGRTGCP